MPAALKETLATEVGLALRTEITKEGDTESQMTTHGPHDSSGTVARDPTREPHPKAGVIQAQSREVPRAKLCPAAPHV